MILLLLGHHVDKFGHIVAEKLTDLLHRVVGVLDHVVEQGRTDGVGTEAYLIGHDHGHRDGMQDIGFATLAALRAVCLLGQGIGATDTEHLLAGKSALFHTIEELVTGIGHHLVIVCRHSRSVF